jgi:hypothetical protein
MRDGILLALAQEREDQFDEALATLTMLGKQPKPPRLLRFIEAEIWTRKGDWKKASEAMADYADASE